MKHGILLCAVWLTLSVASSAQITLPSGIEACKVHWPVGLKRAFQVHGDQLLSGAGDQLVAGQMTELRLDSTISFYQYDLGGGTIIVTPFERTDHFYNETNQEMVVESIFDQIEWLIQSRTRLWRDDAGRLLVSLAETYNAEFDIWEPDSRFRVYPYGDSPSLFDSLLVEEWSAELNGWERLLTIKNTFDANGVLQESRSALTLLGLPVVFREVYAYDLLGYNYQIETYLITDGMEMLVGLEELQYMNGLHVMSTHSAYDEFGTTYPTEQTTISYEENSLPDTIRTFEWDEEKSDWYLVVESISAYDMQHRVISVETASYVLGSLPERSSVHYEYVDDEGTDISRESYFTYDHDTEQFIADYFIKYYYDESTSSVSHVTGVNSLVLSPNPTSSQVEVVLKEAASIWLYNMKGQVINQQQGFQGHNSMDVSDFPVGVYTILVQTNAGILTGRFIKQ